MRSSKEVPSLTQRIFFVCVIYVPRGILAIVYHHFGSNIATGSGILSTFSYLLHPYFLISISHAHCRAPHNRWLPIITATILVFLLESPRRTNPLPLSISLHRCSLTLTLIVQICALLCLAPSELNRVTANTILKYRLRLLVLVEAPCLLLLT